MVREIKTTLALDGEKAFNAALKEAQREMRVMNAGLKEMAEEFKNTDDAQKYFTDKSETLNKKIKQQEEIVNALKNAVKEASERYGEAGATADGYRIKLSNANAELYKMRTEAEEAERALSDLGKSQIEEEFKNSIDEATRSLKLSQSEAKLLGVTYRNNAQDSDFLEKKSDNLKQQIASMEKIYIDTSEAVKRSAEETGDLSEKTVDLKIRMNNARIELTNLRRELDTTNQQMADLGRDSEKVGTQLERGIGDAAEDVEEKLDGMFAKVSSDVNALKGSVAFQTTMDVGEFVMDGIGSVVDFVNENTELNRMISIAKHNIEQYDFNWEEARGLIVRAAAVTGNQEGAFEAISNLVAAGFDTEELMTSAVDALLGAYLKTGGALSFESLAEDFRASVVSRTPTGTYAEVIEEVLQGVLVEDVQKALEGAESTADAIEIALGVLTKGGLPTTTKTYEEANAELIEQQVKQQQLAMNWAKVAENIQPITTEFITIAEKITGALANASNIFGDFNGEHKRWIYTESEDLYSISDKTNQAVEEFYENPENEGGFAKWWSDFWGLTPDKYASEAKKGISLFSSAGAETMDAFAASAMENGSTTLPGLFDDPSMQVDYETIITDAETAGKDLSIKLANGITIMAGEASAATMKMVNDITAILSMIPVPTIGFSTVGIGGYGTGMNYMPNVSVNIDGQTAGNLLYDGISSAASRATQTKMYVK